MNKQYNMKFGDPEFKLYSIDQIEKILDNSKYTKCGLDEAFGGDLYIAESVMRSMLDYIKSIQAVQAVQETEIVPQ